MIVTVHKIGVYDMIIGSGSDDDIQIPYLFKSALDVGSHFVDIVPDNELVFVK